MNNSYDMQIFNHLIAGLDKSLQASLRLMYTRSCMLEEANHKREMEKMKKEIADYVISHISATADISEVVEAIDELRNLIDGLGR